MYSVRFIISLVLIAHGIVLSSQRAVVDSQNQCFDLVIRVDKNKSILMHEVQAESLLNYRTFGIPSSLESDKYYYVKSACCEKALDSIGCFAKIYNVVKKFPSRWLAPEQVQTDYLFPRYVSESFLNTIESDKDKNEFFTQVLTVKDNKKIIFKYVIEYSEKQSETGDEQTMQTDPEIVSAPEDYVVDLLVLLSFIFPL